MLINNTKTINYNATSAVKVNNENKNVMFMYGSINAEGLPSWNTNIADIVLYRANQEEVDGDFEVFKNQILDDADSMIDNA